VQGNRAREAYRKWYEANKETHNRERRAKYAADPRLRERALEKQREYRRGSAKADGKHFRKVGKSQVEVFRIGTVAEMIGREKQVIRQWEAKEYIPPPTVKSTQRFYTARQVQLLGEFVKLMDEVRYDPKHRGEALAKKSQEIKQLWSTP